MIDERDVQASATEATESSPPAAKPPATVPVGADERVGSVDVLRGFALLGILVMNIYAFGLTSAAYFNPLEGGGQGLLDRATWWFTHVLFEFKFMTIFSMLFGAGVVLMVERAVARGRRALGVHYRRMLWLLLIGLVHAYLMWWGDILVWYALCGLVLYPLRRVRPSRLIVVAVVFLLIPIGTGSLFGHVIMPMLKQQAVDARAAEAAGDELTEEQTAAIETWDTIVESQDPPPERVTEEIEVFAEGSWAEQVVFRAPLVISMQTGSFLFFGFWRAAGAMILGMALMKLGVFAARRSNAFYGLWCLIGYGVGLPVVAWGAKWNVDNGFDIFHVNQGGFFPNYLASLLVAMAHVSLVMLACRAGLLQGLSRRLAAVGRMAFTSYLSHTVILTTVFYGWGLGLYDRFGRFELMGFVLGVWIFQLLISPWWLKRFRFGPAEWLWRSLTYWKRQPMRAGAATSSPG